MKPATFYLIFHIIKVVPGVWELVIKKIKIGGFLKCKIHFFSLNGFKSINPQTLCMPEIEPGPPGDNQIAMQNDLFIICPVRDATFFWTANFED